MANGSFKKGDMVNVNMDENKNSRSINVIGRGAALMGGRIYEVGQKGIRQDRAEVQLNMVGANGIETRRVEGWEIRPSNGSDNGRGIFVISNPPSEKFNAIDFATGRIGKVAQGIDKVTGEDVFGDFKVVEGRFFNDTAYVPQNGFYVLEKSDPLVGQMRTRKLRLCRGREAGEDKNGRFE